MSDPSTTAMPKPAPARAGLARFVPLALLAGLCVALWLGGARDWVSRDMLAARHAELLALVSAHVVLACLGFAAVYAVVTATVLPVGTPLAMAGGLMFGLAGGTALIVVGATAGAVLLFLAARTAAGDALRRRAGPRLDSLLAQLEAEQASTLLVLRLVPLFPFWLVNLAPGFAHVRLWTFAWTTFVGIIPGTLVHAWIGVQLGRALASGTALDTAALFQLATPPLLALGALSALPLAWRWWRSRTNARA